MLKDILVHVDTSNSARTRISTAIAIAKRYHSNLTGLYADDWAEHIMMMAPEIVPAVTESQRVLWEQRQVEAKALFDEITAAETLPSEWISLEGEIAYAICSKTFTSDLTILQQHDKDDPKVPDFDITHSILLGSGSPVLIVPNHYSVNAPGKKIMIAWNDSKESSRAVRDALPFLLKADSVELVSIQTNTSIDLKTIDIDRAAEHLARHNIPINKHMLDDKQSHHGDTLLTFAKENDIDLIVMGAYGHSRIREVILGGTTRFLLKNTTIPILMSH